MKKLIILVAIFSTSVTTYAQSVFDKFEDMDDVSSVVVSQRMFKLLTQIDIQVDDQESQDFVDMIKNLTSLKVFTTEDGAVSTQMKTEVDRYLKQSKLEELMRIKDGNKNVKFYIRAGRDENHVSELLMFVTGLKDITKNSDISINGKKREFETVLLTLTGDIDLRQISKLTKSMDIPGGEQLEKVNKE